MTERTFNIIMCCKSKLYPEVEGGIDRIKMYMSEECDCSPEDYGWVELKQIMQEALYIKVQLLQLKQQRFLLLLIL